MRGSFLILCFAFVQAFSGEIRPIIDLGPTNEFGAGVQRSLRWMADSSPERKRTVRVLFYGQSITLQPWSAKVGQWLRAEFPNANIIVTNLAISGFTSDMLNRCADADILRFYPDLIIYQNYGPIAQIEEILARTRARTTADILLQNEHPTAPEDLTEGISASSVLSAAARRNYIELPELAQRYGAEFCDVRSPWKAYLGRYDLQPADVLLDHIHPNYEEGGYLLTEIVKSHLRVDRGFSDGAWRSAVRTIPVPREKWSTLMIPFEGNRVDVVVAKNSTAPIEVWIDGKRPSEFPELYAFSRPESYPGTPFPCILQVNSRAPLLEESWTATVLESYRKEGVPHIRFALRGSKTGPDGEGSSESRFISNSGRVVLRASDWPILRWAMVFSLPPLPVGHEIKWQSDFFGMDEVVAEISDLALENSVTLAQGLANGPHTLTLRGTDTTAVEAVRIYNPLVRTQPARASAIQIESVARSSAGISILASRAGRYVLESAPRLGGPWQAISSPQTEPAMTAAVASQTAFFRLRQLD